jgi:hypothetical protein
MTSVFSAWTSCFGRRTLRSAQKMPAASDRVPLPPVDEDEPLLHVRGGGLTDELLVRKLRAVFHYLVVGEIRRVLAPDEPPGVASAILTLCAIDFLGSLYAGADATGVTLKVFVADFLPAYAPRRLSNMRNRLVHNYVNRGGYTFTAGRDRKALHNTSTPSSLIVIDVLLEDVEAAAERLFADAWQDLGKPPGSNVIKRAKEPGLMWMTAA